MYAHHFGAPIDFQRLLGARNTNVIWNETKIRISILKIINYGIRPKSTQALPPDNCYQDSDLLNPKYLLQPVFYATHFSASDFGMISLTSSEIDSCFGLMNWSDTHKFLVLPPLQTLDIVLRSLPSFNTPELVPNSLHWSRSSTSPVSSSSWLHTVRQHLSYSWMHLEGDFSHAVKSDNANVPISLWNR